MIRAWLGAGGVTLLALLACLDFYRLMSLYNRSHQDPYRIGAQQERWRQVSQLVPAGAVLGYISDMTLEERSAAPSSLAAPYALAPRLLVDLKPGREVRWVVGDFAKPADLQKIQAEHGLRLVRDFGGGLALFEREAH